MITLLEFVCTRLLGPPIHWKGDGESQWPCPRCAHRRFHTLPRRDGYKDRFKCWRCDFRGDVFDLLKFHFTEDYGQRLARLADYEAEYNRSGLGKCPPATARHQGEMTEADLALFFFRGVRAGIEERERVASAWEELSDAEQSTLLAAREVMARFPKVRFEPLADYCADFAEHVRQSDELDRRLEKARAAVRKPIPRRIK